MASVMQTQSPNENYILEASIDNTRNLSLLLKAIHFRDVSFRILALHFRRYNKALQR